jgi:hypothetical protein
VLLRKKTNRLLAQDGSFAALLAGGQFPFLPGLPFFYGAFLSHGDTPSSLDGLFHGKSYEHG